MKEKQWRIDYTLDPVHTNLDIFVSVTFLLRIGLSFTLIRRSPAAYPETFESTLQSGNFFIRAEQLGQVRTVEYFYPIYMQQSRRNQ